MAATIRRLRTRKDLLDERQADLLREGLIAHGDALGVPKNVVARVCAKIDAAVASANGWTFLMLSPDQNDAVVEWLMDHSARPKEAGKLWAKCFRYLNRDTGEIAATRAELSGATGIAADNVSRIMSELVSIKAVIRHREGGRVSYYLNPNVGTHLAGVARDKTQAAAPLVDPQPRPKRQRQPRLALVPPAE